MVIAIKLRGTRVTVYDAYASSDGCWDAGPVMLNPAIMSWITKSTSAPIEINQHLTC
jgi:hypothetical protein